MLLIMQSSSASLHFLPLSSKCSHHLVLQHLQRMLPFSDSELNLKK